MISMLLIVAAWICFCFFWYRRGHSRGYHDGWNARTNFYINVDVGNSQEARAKVLQQLKDSREMR